MSNKTNNTAVNAGDNVSVHYKGTFSDGSVFDSSYDRGTPINFTIGTGNMIEGFESNILGMTSGQKKKFTLAPDQAYGPHDDQAVQTVPKNNFPENFNFTPGSMVTGSNPAGGTVNATILSENTDSIVLDFNHPMAGKDLTFEVEVMEITTPETSDSEGE